MTFDTIAFMETAAKNGYTAVAAVADVLAGRTSGDNFETIKAGHISMATQISAAIANFVGGRFRHSRDPNYCELKAFFARDQTGAVDLHNLAYIAYPFKSGSVLNCWMDNGNNAQYEAMLLWLTYDGTPAPRPFPLSTPLNTKWVYGTGAATLVAATWTDASITWGETFEKDVIYKIAGLAAYSATGYAARLKFAGSSPTSTSYPSFQFN